MHILNTAHAGKDPIGGDWTRGKVESSLPLAVIKSTAWWKKCWRDQGSARIDHAPEDEPAFHVPETTARNADRNISIRLA